MANLKLSMKQVQILLILFAALLLKCENGEAACVEQHPWERLAQRQQELSFVLHKVERVELRFEDRSHSQINSLLAFGVAKALVEDGLILCDSKKHHIDGVLSIWISPVDKHEECIVRLCWDRELESDGVMVNFNYTDAKICSKEKVFQTIENFVSEFGDIWRSSNIRLEDASG